MTTLWLIVLVLLLATLLCLIPPLVRRAPKAEPAADAGVRAFYLAQREQLQRDLNNGSLDAEARARAEDELQRDLLQDLAMRQPRATPWGGQRAGVATACLICVLIPVAAVLLYGKLGNPRVAAGAAALPVEPHAEASSGDMGLAINALAQRLRAEPNDPDGWYMLARSYETVGRFTDAVAAYQQVLRLVPGQAAVLADLADALLSANQGKPNDASISAVAQALAAQPDQPKALALAGMLALRRGDAAEALTHWERLQAQLPPDSDAARQIQSNIALARAMAAGAPPMAAAAPSTPPAPAVPATAAAPAAAPKAAAAARISGRARIADALRGQVQPTDTVFILARPENGPRMPLAILQLQVADLPRDFVLDDSSAMSPDATLSRADRVRVEIRVSRSGTAATRPGDLNGALSNVGTRADGLELVADTVVR